MKNQLLILIAIFIGMASSNATVYTVSNDPNNPAQFNNFADAHTAASPGDTLYVFGSPNDYGTVEIYKPLTIIGAGYNPENQYQYPTTFGKIYLNDEGSSSASGTTLIGIKAKSGLNNQNMIDNISIFYCDLSIYVGVSGTFSNPMQANNWIIRNNILISIDAGTYAKNFIISNNIIKRSIDNFQDPSIIISNNLFINSYTGIALNDMSYSTFVNNIFYGANVSSTESCLAEFCTFNNNLSYYPGGATEFINGECNNTGSNILENTDPLFISIPPTYFSYDGNYNLQPSSPSTNAGTDGTDIGITGGQYPWPEKADETLDLTGMPPIPQIIQMDILNPVLPVNGKLTVKVKAHN